MLMKKRLLKGLLIGIAIVLFLYCFVRYLYPNNYPEEGVWYCEELYMTIDFSSDNDKSVRIYHEDGTYTVYRCNIDFGRGIHIRTIEKERYMNGQFWLVGNTFIVNFDGKICFFRELTDGQLPPL